MKRLLSIAAIAVLAAGCNWSEADAETRDAGPAVARTYPVGSFDRIRVMGPYAVTVVTGRQPGVSARGGEAILAETEIAVENGVLRIGPKNKRNVRWNWGRDSRVTVAVTTAALRGAEIAGSGDIAIDRAANTAFEAEVAGSGNLRIGRIEGGSLKVAVAGSGEVSAAGRADTLDVSIAGSGDVDLAGLEVADADISIAGSGNVRAQAKRVAKVSIMGSGDVAISGGARCDVTKAGSGDVRCS